MMRYVLNARVLALAVCAAVTVAAGDIRRRNPNEPGERPDLAAMRVTRELEVDRLTARAR